MTEAEPVPARAAPEPSSRRARWRRRGLIALGAVVVMVAAPLVLYRVSVQPGAAPVKFAFEAGTDPAPAPGSTVQVDGVTVHVGVPVRVDGAPSARIDIYTATPQGPARPTVLWVHGGGFISNSSWVVHQYAARLARDGYTVAALDYTLAPGARYPTPVRQANAAFAFLRQHAGAYGGSTDAFFIGGDSAGAQIASETAAVESDATFARRVGVARALTDGQLRGAVLFCGLYDMQTVGGSGFPALRTFLWAYTGQRDYLSYSRIGELSTVQTASATYPATFIAVGDGDLFQAQGFELAEALRAKGVDVTTQFWKGSGQNLPHEYQFDLTSSAAQTTLTNTVAFLNQHATDGAGP